MIGEEYLPYGGTGSGEYPGGDQMEVLYDLPEPREFVARRWISRIGVAPLVGYLDSRIVLESSYLLRETLHVLYGFGEMEAVYSQPHIRLGTTPCIEAAIGGQSGKLVWGVPGKAISEGLGKGEDLP